MLEELKKEVLEANLMLKENKLAVLTWGNVSGIDRGKGFIVIKPSGVPYDNMSVDDLVVLDLDGNIVEGNLKPSSDTPTHLELYKNFSEIGAVVHTHSSYATSWAQSGRDIPPYGTTHADFSNCVIPCARSLTEDEVNREYELNTGKVIVEEFAARNIKSCDCPAVLVKRHGPFTWGKTPLKAVENSIILEEVAKMAFQTELIASADNSTDIGVEEYLLKKHYERKHGANAYYGQDN